MQVRMFPNFMRKREQRIKSTPFTPFQGLAAVILLPLLIIASQTSLWLSIPMVAFMAFAMYISAPVEGTFRVMLWAYYLRASFAPQSLDSKFRFFARLGGREESAMPLVALRDGRTMIAAEVMSPDEDN